MSGEEAATLTAVEEAARRLDGLFDGKGPQVLGPGMGVGVWKLNGRKVTDEAALALLILHDCLNDVERARDGLTIARRGPQ